MEGAGVAAGSGRALGMRDEGDLGRQMWRGEMTPASSPRGRGPGPRRAVPWPAQLQQSLQQGSTGPGSSTALP